LRKDGLKMSSSAKITPEMGIMEVVEKYPKAAGVFRAFGMGCLGCAAAHFETIGQGAAAHGMDIPALMDALNQIAEEG
jgi:hybrid cluster-associated redox disulfide protein